PCRCSGPFGIQQCAPNRNRTAGDRGLYPGPGAAQRQRAGTRPSRCQWPSRRTPVRGRGGSGTLCAPTCSSPPLPASSCCPMHGSPLPWSSQCYPQHMLAQLKRLPSQAIPRERLPLPLPLPLPLGVAAAGSQH
uniref:Uncharacterized protein n=1 Tax=Malurus cyaneus samueli TaxID=2593467 RepID=A0A8C5TTL8_9PASS